MLPSFILYDALIGYPIFKTVFIIYLITFLDNSEKNGARSPLWTGWTIWKWFRSYFSIKIVHVAPLDQNQYIFATHPHSVLPLASTIAFCSSDCDQSFESMFPNLRMRALAASFCFLTPLWRDMCLFAGAVDADHHVAENMLGMGYSLLIYPGGAQEALYVDPEVDNVIIKENPGIIRLAMKTGVPIVPCYCFNEANNWKPLKVSIWFVDLFRKWFQILTGISLPLTSNFWPYASQCTLVLSTPIHVEKKSRYTKEDIQKYRDVYIEAIQNLHDTYSPIYSIPNTKKLRILTK